MTYDHNDPDRNRGMEALRGPDPMDAEIERLREALEWYGRMAKRMGKAAIRQDSQTMLALMKELAVDYGGRARAALSQEQS